MMWWAIGVGAYAVIACIFFPRIGRWLKRSRKALDD